MKLKYLAKFDNDLEIQYFMDFLLFYFFLLILSDVRYDIFQAIRLFEIEFHFKTKKF